MRDASDMELLREYAQQDSETAFAELVHRHVNLVYSAALRHVGMAAQAEEITQAVFVILARKAASLRAGLVLDAWLFETTRLTALSFLRGERRRQFREQEAYMQSVLQESAPDPVWPQLAPLLDEAMMHLGRRDREAVVLRFFKGQSLGEVAAALDIKEPAAQKRVDRALEKLHRYFSRRGISSTTALIAGTISANSVQLAPVMLAKTVATVAAAKGMAAPISTLTLITGAMKIMAWTKAKTAIVAGASALLVVGTTTITVKEIATHKQEASWRVVNPDPDRAPKMVKILPTKFPVTVDSLNVGSRGDNWVGVGEPVLQIARVAYAWRPGRIVFASPQPKERYDFISTLPQGTGIALQRELKKELGYAGHTETRDMDVLVLKVARQNAPGLQSPVSGRQDYMNRGHYHCDNSPISSDGGWYPGIARFLEDYFKTPVIDQTGLTQNFCIDLKWDERFQGDPNHDALKQALLDQLGLELVPDLQPVEMLVMDKVK